MKKTRKRKAVRVSEKIHERLVKTARAEVRSVSDVAERILLQGLTDGRKGGVPVQENDENPADR